MTQSFYDPDTQPLSVGESTTPHIGSLIFETLDISIGDLADNGIISYKNGIKYIGWGSGGSFRHHFHGGECAFHFESGILNPFIHNHLEKELGIKYHAERVDDYEIDGEQVHVNNKEYDFVVNCAGWDDDSEYYKPVFETVNAAILYTSEVIDDPTYTLHRYSRWMGIWFTISRPKPHQTRLPLQPKSLGSRYTWEENLMDSKVLEETDTEQI